jgi:DNA polymerase III epsilon subunit-like protein
VTAPICFIDTETTGVHPGRRAWEIAIIRREPDGTETEWLGQVSDVDLSEADPFGLKIGRFYDRHPAYDGTHPDGVVYATEESIAPVVERFTRGAHLVGAVPNFDAEVFADMLRRHRLTPAWHYHLIDVEALAVGYLHGKETLGGPGPLPWKSDTLSRAIGVEPASDDERHTALGDARWARRIYDEVTGSSASSTTTLGPADAGPNVRWLD